MVRSLWTGATGMIAQQLNVDSIANNLSNVNTTAYKTEVMEFKSLLYQTIQTKSTTANAENKPIGAEVGLGTRNSSIQSIFTQGSVTQTEQPADFAIDGEGFFSVLGADGNTYFTRNGHFVWAEGTDGLVLSNSDGLPVLSSSGGQITLDTDQVVSKVTINSKTGEICYPDDNGNAQGLGVYIGLYQFNNPSGLDKVGDSLYQITPASGEALNERTNTSLTDSKLLQGYLESSNVQIADEMVNLIVAQRAYEMNSKVITTSDEMLQQANQLKR